MSYFGHFELFWRIWAIFAVLVYFSCCFGFFGCFGQFWLFLTIFVVCIIFSFLGHLLFWPKFAVLDMLGCLWLIWWFQAIFSVLGYVGCWYGLFTPFLDIFAVLGYLGCFGRFRLFSPFLAVFSVLGYSSCFWLFFPGYTLIFHICQFGSLFVVLGPYFGCFGRFRLFWPF